MTLLIRGINLYIRIIIHIIQVSLIQHWHVVREGLVRSRLIGEEKAKGRNRVLLNPYH